MQTHVCKFWRLRGSDRTVLSRPHLKPQPRTASVTSAISSPYRRSGLSEAQSRGSVQVSAMGVLSLSQRQCAPQVRLVCRAQRAKKKIIAHQRHTWPWLPRT